MKKEKFIADLLAVFKGMEVEENEELLPVSWKKSTIDYTIYTKQENGERIPFAFVVCTNDSKKNSINKAYAKKLIKHIVDDTVAWMGFVVDKNSISSYSSAIGELQTSLKWINNITISEVEIAVAEIVKREQNFNEAAFKDELVMGIDSLTLKTQREKKMAPILKTFIAANSLNRVGRTISFDFKSQFDLICDTLRSAKVKSATTFCRYSSISSLYRNINGRCESMCGLAGMNDKSEGFYLGYCLNPNSTFDISRKSQWVVDNYNKAYIVSLCDEEQADELTMWRLYGGNDGDGVCLIYELDEEKIRNNKEFILSPVMYGNNNNIIVQLFRLISRLPFVGGYQFVIGNRDVWSYFVKPDDFKIEKEYRLLYIDGQSATGKAKWIYNDGVGIVHPVVEISLNDYPLKLKKIILGPKCCEKGVNRVQMQTWLKSLNRIIEVVESDIKLYR